MGKRNTRESDVTIGLDLGDKWSEGAVLDARGEVVERVRVRSTPKGFDQAFASYEGVRLVLEVGTHSPWASRRFTARGFEVIVANPRRVRLIAQGDSKTDEFDAELLARLGRVDPNLLSPIVHRGEAAQRDLSLIRSRDGLVRARTQLINQVRGFAKSLGIRLPGSSSEAFPRRVTAAAGREVFPGCSVLLEMVERLTQEIRRMDREIERLCRERYPETERLRQVKGVGPITALCFVLTLEDPDRFETSRAVGAYLGLRPKIRNSGAHEPQLRITKGGDVLLRRLLVSGAQYILGPFGPDTDLRRFGLALAERGGKAAKKRAVVAVARKLAVLLHCLWVTGETYQPVGYAEAKRQAAA
jgi:transposase